MSARAMRTFALGLLGALCTWSAVGAGAQQRGAPPPGPSRADEYLAVGRLALAERELYAAVAAEPRQPAPRGALARYLASRGRFRIAEELFLEALRFGADTPSVARAMAAMEPYRAPVERRPIPGVRVPPAVVARARARAEHGGDEVIDGTEVTVPLQVIEGGSAIARFRARGRDSVWVTIDLTREGIAVSSADDPALALQVFGGRGSGSPALIEELWIGERRLAWLDAYVDQSVPIGEVRVGVDLLWRWRAIVDARDEAGTGATFTLPFAGARVEVPPGAFHLPVVLRFPGLALVPQPGIEPFLLSSPRGRRYLRATRWQVDRATATLVVKR